MNEMKMEKMIKVLNSLNRGNTFTEEDLYQKIKLGGRNYVEKINSMLLRARRKDLLISKEEFEFIKNCCEVEEILPASTIDYDESHYQEVEFTEVSEVQDTKDICESQQILPEGKIEKIVKVLNSLNRGNPFTKENFYQNIQLGGRSYIEKINSMLLRARRKDLLLTQEQFDFIKNQDEVEEIFPIFEYDESLLPMAEFTSIDTKDVLNHEWQKILNNPKYYDTLLGRKKTIDEILTSKLPPNVSSIREEEILEKKQYFFDSIAELKTYWREMWKSDFSVNSLLDEFFFLSEEDAELIFDACNEEEKALYNDYFDKLHEIDGIILQYQVSFEDLQDLDEVSGKFLLRLLSSRDRKKFLNIFKEKKAIFKKVDLEQLEKDALVYGYYKSCKKLLRNSSLRMKDVKSFVEVSKNVKEKFEAMIGHEDKDKSLNYMQGITHATSKANEKDVTSVLNSNQDVSEKKSFVDYFDSLKKEKRIEWQNVVDRSKRFMTSVRNLSFVERFKLKDHYEAVKHPIKRKLVYGGLVAGSVLSFFGGVKACSSKALEEDKKVEDTKHTDFEAKKLFSNIKVEQPEAKEIFAESVLGDFEKKTTIESKRKELTEMREKIVTLQSIVTEKAKTQNVVASEILFGDVVNLKNNSVMNYPDIYSATYEQNGSKSYFGDSLERVVDSIFFSKDGEVMNTHTYEEYQNALAQGYTLEGYTLVNQNSLNPENLIVEGRYVKEDVTLVRK